MNFYSHTSGRRYSLRHTLPSSNRGLEAIRIDRGGAERSVGTLPVVLLYLHHLDGISKEEAPAISPLCRCSSNEPSTTRIASAKTVCFSAPSRFSSNCLIDPPPLPGFSGL